MMDEVAKLAEHHTADGIIQKLKSLILILLFFIRVTLEPSPILRQ
jgi:hypothetical protein